MALMSRLHSRIACSSSHVSLGHHMHSGGGVRVKDQPGHLQPQYKRVDICSKRIGRCMHRLSTVARDSKKPGPAATTTLEPAAAAAAVAPAPPSHKPYWHWEDSTDALLAYGVLTSVLLAGAVPNPLIRSDNGSDLVYFIALAVCTQYIGAHRGLTTAQRQQLSIKEGLLAPVLASVSLLSCYLLIRFLPEINISTFLNAYFWLLGTFAATGALSPLLRQVGGPLAAKSLAIDMPDGWLADEDGKPVKKAEFAPADVLAVVGALTLSTSSLLTGNYTFNNVMACLIATDILQLIGIRSFRVACALLVGLLLYDVFWVFGSPMVMDNGDNVMLTVATSDIITGPSRLLFPRTPGGVGEAADFPFSLLGLGDIAIPGLLACLSLRYDASRAVDMGGRAEAAVEAMKDAWAHLPASASAQEMGDAAAAAADSAIDRFAESEQRQWQAGSSSGTHSTPSNGNGTSNGDANSNGNGNGAGPTAAAVTPGTAAGSNPEPVKQYAHNTHVSEAVLGQRTYFTPVMVAYVAGLAMAFAANSITHLGQPALLYIVPSTLIALLLTGATRAELKQLWSFTDVPSFGLPAAQEKENKQANKQ